MSKEWSIGAEPGFDFFIDDNIDPKIWIISNNYPVSIDWKGYGVVFARFIVFSFFRFVLRAKILFHISSGNQNV